MYISSPQTDNCYARLGSAERNEVDYLIIIFMVKCSCKTVKDGIYLLLIFKYEMNPLPILFICTYSWNIHSAEAEGEVRPTKTNL